MNQNPPRRRSCGAARDAVPVAALLQPYISTPSSAAWDAVPELGLALVKKKKRVREGKEGQQGKEGQVRGSQGIRPFAIVDGCLSTPVGGEASSRPSDSERANNRAG